MPIGYCGRNRRFYLWRFSLHIEQLLERLHVARAHNHPSGDPAPSSADLQVTRRLREAATAVDIELTDHLIIGTKASDPTGRGFYSFRDAGLL